MSLLQDVGSVVGSALPIPGGSQIGGVVGSVLGKITGFFGGGGSAPVAGGLEGYHSAVVSAIDDSQVNQPDAELYIILAKKSNITVEEVAILLAYECQYWGSGSTAKYTWDAYAYGARAGGSSTTLDGQLGLFNASGLGVIVPGGGGASSHFALAKIPALLNYNGVAKISFLTARASSTVVQPVPVPTSGKPYISSTVAEDVPLATTNAFLGISSQDIKEVGGAALAAAKKAAIDRAMQTNAGKEATSAGAKQFVQDNLVYGIPLAGVLTWLCIKAFSKK